MKYTYRLTPVREYDIAGVESWLEDMAGRGLYLKRFRPLFCTFRRDHPGELRYRLEPCPRGMDDAPPHSMLELYEQFGWTCVDNVNRTLLVFSTRDPDAPELHSDPKLQEKQWRGIYRSVRNSFLANLFLLLLLIAFIGYLLWGSGTPVLSLIENSVLPLSLLAIWVVAQLIASAPDLLLLSAAVRQLKDGIPLSHRSVYPRRRPGTVIGFAASLVVLLLLVISSYILPFLDRGIQPLDQVQDFTPLQLSSLEGPNYQPDSFVADGRDYANFSRRERHLLCWRQWEVVETGQQSKEGHWIRLEVQWYDLALPFLGRPLALEQLQSATRLDADIWWTAPPDAERSWIITQYPGHGLDFLAVAREETGNFQAAAAALDGRTVVVRYTGLGNLTEHLDEIIAMVRR